MRTMQKVRQVVIFFLICFAVKVHAQQRPYYTQYILNNYIINPAVAGIENYTDVKLSHRMQWVGLDGAPVTTYFTIHAPLKKSDYDRETPTTFHRRGENPRGEAYWENYQKPENHVGVGFTILNDKTGPLNRFAAYGSIAYHMGISAGTTLSFGASGGMSQMSLDASKLNFGAGTSGGQFDPVVSGANQLNTMKLDVNAGLWLYSRDYFIGLALQQIVPQRLYFSEYSNSNPAIQERGKLVPHMFLQAGVKMFFSEDWALLPSVMVRYVDPLPVGFDINAKLQYLDLLWVGGSYRFKDSYSAMLGVNLNNSINIGYSYDITTSNLNTVSKGTHEFLVGFLLGNRYGDWCPKRLF